MFCKSKSGAGEESWLSSWGTRHRLALTGFFMCALLYSLRFNLSIGIVAMVDDMYSSSTTFGNSKSSSRHSHGEMCPSLADDLDPTDLNDSLIFEERRSVGSLQNAPKHPTFQWSEKDQGLILGSFFWGYMISQYPGGLLAQKFGGKWVISLGVLWTGILSILIPQALYLGGRDMLILLRVLQGIGEGLVIPATHVLIAKWTLPEERAQISALCFSGLPFGTAATMIISGYLIPAFGWPSVFYVPGILTIIWFMMWSICVYSTPQEHPRISAAELERIEKSLGKETDEERNESMLGVPWKEILLSAPFWAIFISQFGNAWGHNMLKSEGPKYLHSALRFDIHQNSYLSAAPYVGQFVFMMVVGRVSDYLIKTQVLTVGRARKLCNTLGQWGAAAAFVGVVLAGCNRPMAVICFILSGLLNGAMLCGSLINPMDISPRYVGPIEGAINSAANIAGFGAPYVAGLILHHQPSIVGWRLVFLIPVVSNVIGNLAFLLGASVKVQPWNYISRRKPVTAMFGI